MSAYLYYRRASPVLPDAYYDMLVKDLTRGWARLSELRQWQFVSVEELAATGHHIKVTRAAEGGAIHWHAQEKGLQPSGYGVDSEEWKLSPRGMWVTAEPVGVERRRIVKHRVVQKAPEQFKLF